MCTRDGGSEEEGRQRCDAGASAARPVDTRLPLLLIPPRMGGAVGFGLPGCSGHIGIGDRWTGGDGKRKAPAPPPPTRMLDAGSGVSVQPVGVVGIDGTLDSNHSTVGKHRGGALGAPKKKDNPKYAEISAKINSGKN